MLSKNSLTEDSSGNLFLFDGTKTTALGSVKMSTGVNDKNQVLIYLDDIVSFKPSFNQDPITGVIIFINGGFAVKTKDGYQYLWAINMFQEEFVVIDSY